MDLAVTTTVLVIVHEKVALPELAGVALSDAVRVTVVTPGVVGVPVMAPVEALMDSPVGRAEAAHAVMEAPDELVDATGLKEMTPLVTLVLEPGLVTVMAPETFQVKVADPAKVGVELSVAVMVTEHAHEDVGVPVTDPVEELMASPVGRPLWVQVRVRPVWVSVAEFASEEMAEPTAEDCPPGLVTTTVLVVVQVKEAADTRVAAGVALSDNEMITEQEHGTVGVPEMIPVEEPMVRPTGRPVALQVLVAVVEVSVPENVTGAMAEPVTADCVEGVVVTATVLVMVQVKLAEFE